MLKLTIFQKNRLNQLNQTPSPSASNNNVREPNTFNQRSQENTAHSNIKNNPVSQIHHKMVVPLNKKKAEF